MTPLLLALILSSPADDGAETLVTRHLGQTVEVYKWFHRNPEISNQEEKTAAHFASELRAAGWKTTEHVGGHGVIGVLVNGAGPTLLVRVDMDALPIKEETGLPYASSNGAMHACGHDIHMAAGVGLARVLAGAKSSWAGTVVLVGQPAEEVGSGARAMLADPKFRAAFAGKPIAVLSIHDTHFLPAGAVGICSGACTAYVDQIEVTLFGRGGHSGAPHKAVNPIDMGADVVSSLALVAAKRVSPIEPAAVSVNAFHSGNKNGVIPEQATLLITVRALGSEAHDILLNDMRYVTERVAETHHAPKPPVIKVDASYVGGTQDPAFVRKGMDALKPAFGEVVAFEPIMAGEDFFELARAFDVPALQLRVGAVPPRLMGVGKTWPMQHSSTFAPDPEPTLRSGVLGLTKLCIAMLPPGS